MAQKKGQTGNKSGRPVGAKNKYTFDVKAKLAEGMNNEFIEDIYTQISLIDSPSEKVKAQLKLLEFFVPKAKDQGEIEQDNEFRRIFMERLLPK